MTRNKKLFIGMLPFLALIVLLAIFCGIVSAKGYRLDMYRRSYLMKESFYPLSRPEQSLFIRLARSISVWERQLCFRQRSVL